MDHKKLKFENIVVKLIIMYFVLLIVSILLTFGLGTKLIIDLVKNNGSYKLISDNYLKISMLSAAISVILIIPYPAISKYCINNS